MYGYKKKQSINKTRVFTYLAPFIILFIFILLVLLKYIQIENSAIITLIIALVGWPIAVDNIFLQVNNSLKRKLETEAIKKIDNAMVKISSTFAATVTFTNDFVVQPVEVPDDLWFKAAKNKWSTIAEQTMKMRDAYSELYRELEANEIAIIHLEQYYRYLTIIIGDFIEHADRLNGQFALATTNFSLSEKKYKDEVAKFKPLQEEWANIAMYCMDFRKMIQNALLSDVFKRVLEPRKPLVGYGTTLDKVATKKEVQRLIDERNEKLGLPKGLS